MRKRPSKRFEKVKHIVSGWSFEKIGGIIVWRW